MENLELKFLKIIHKGKAPTKKVITLAGTEHLNHSPYDFFYAESLGKAQFKNRNGEWYDWPNEESRLDNYTICVFKCMLANPGVQLTRERIKALTGLSWDVLLHLPSHILFLRSAFAESKTTEYFICTNEKRPLKLWWPRELTYLWIEPYKEGIVVPGKSIRQIPIVQSSG